MLTNSFLYIKTIVKRGFKMANKKRHGDKMSFKILISISLKIIKLKRFYFSTVGSYYPTEFLSRCQ